MLLEEIAGNSLNPVNHQNGLFSFEEREGYEPFEGRFFIITPKKDVPFVELAKILYRIYNPIGDSKGENSKNENLAYIINLDLEKVRKNVGEHNLNDVFLLAKKCTKGIKREIIERDYPTVEEYFKRNKKSLGLDYDVKILSSKKVDSYTYRELDYYYNIKGILSFLNFISVYPNINPKEAFLFLLADKYAFDVEPLGYIQPILEEMRTFYLNSNIFLGKIL